MKQERGNLMCPMHTTRVTEPAIGMRHILAEADLRGDGGNGPYLTGSFMTIDNYDASLRLVSNSTH